MEQPMRVSSSADTYRKESLLRLGLNPNKWDILIALAGNPNVGKSTVFNALTGLRQHTGNWPGKTIVRAEGAFAHRNKRIKLVDLPGTYSLQAGSVDEEVAREFILFGRPDVTVVVVDATRLERNLNLALQILDITNRVIVYLNLTDEARRHGIGTDPKRLEQQLGVPVITGVARSNIGINELLDAAHDVATGSIQTTPYRIARHDQSVEQAVASLTTVVEETFPGLPSSRWVSQRLLTADDAVIDAVRSGELGRIGDDTITGNAAEISEDKRSKVLSQAQRLRWELPDDFQDKMTERTFHAAEQITATSQVRGLKKTSVDIDWALDRLLTNRWVGFPVMLLILAAVFWATIEGANVPSAMLASLLIDTMHPLLRTFGESTGLPWWANGFLFDGVYLATAWVVAVMLPPMAIFFPLFTLLEDFGYLPRVAFNLDSLFRRAGAHGKQALTMCMGFGCNAAGVVATRIIDSPRERLIAILTNNFSLCNGRWPTQILIATIFIGALAPAHLAGLASASAVVGIALLGVATMFFSSWLLSQTVLRGQATTFSLELPPYRPPRVLQTLYTSLIDRTLIVLWRAVIFAVPAGAVIWLSSNVTIGTLSIAEHAVAGLNPLGMFLGLNGVILVAYIVAIPANEIVIPTILMLTVLTDQLTGGAGTGIMFELESATATSDLLRGSGWTLLTGVNLMLFSLLHNPCSTTIYTIFRETRSARWTTLAAVLPLAMGFTVCFVVAQMWRLFN
jgi:ferrous iron transport protein B